MEYDEPVLIAIKISDDATTMWLKEFRYIIKPTTHIIKILARVPLEAIKSHVISVISQPAKIALKTITKGVLLI